MPDSTVSRFEDWAYTHEYKLLLAACIVGAVLGLVWHA